MSSSAPQVVVDGVLDLTDDALAGPASAEADAGLDAGVDAGAKAGSSVRGLVERLRPRTPLDNALEPDAVLLPAAHAARPTSWLVRYVFALVALDALAMSLAGVFALTMRFGADGLATVALGNGTTYLQLVALAVPCWGLVLSARRAYEPRYLGVGSEEFRRVTNASLLFTSVFAIICVAFDLQPARLVVAVALPLASVLTLVLRYAARKVLHRCRRDGQAGHRVLVVADALDAEVLVDRLARSPHAGLGVVATTGPRQGPDGEPSLAHVPRLVAQLGVDTVAVAHSPGVTPAVLRQLSWSLEGTGIDLLVAPALTDVAGPRIHVRPVSGLPLLQVAQPQFTGARRLLKETQDRSGALVLLLMAAPVLAAAATAVRLSSRGPVLFRQERVGLDGAPFTMFKLRSMVADAEARRAEVVDLNDHGDDHVLFKATADPRVTAVGRLLRRYSIDELPQLVNVLLGQMSLVGPRPPLPDEVAMYAEHVHRRLLVKPGLTGLWQVSGRADLDWQESVRIDLYYVENWSPVLDLEILWKTIFTVFTGAGAR